MATLSNDGKKVLNNYCRYTGVPFNATIISNWVDGTIMSDLRVDNAIFFKNNPVVVPDGGYSKRDFEGAIDVTWFGAKGDYDEATGEGTNNTVIFALAVQLCSILKKDLYVPPGKYLVNKFGRFNNINIRGEKAEIYLKFLSGLSVVMVQFGSNSIVEGIEFSSLELDLNFQRAGIEQADGAQVINCGFNNFLNPTNGNAWGTYIKNSKNVIIQNCRYNNNTQSDLTIVDGCTNITIINPMNTAQNGVYFNVEPNGNSLNAGISVIGGIFRRVYAIINTYTADPIQGLTFSGSWINELRYKGASIRLLNTPVMNLINADIEYMGDLDMAVQMGENLLKDPYLYDVEVSDQNRSWISVLGAFRVDRNGKDYSTINYENTAQVCVISTPSFTNVESDTVYFFGIHGRGNYLDASIQVSRNADIRCYDDNGYLMSTIQFSLFRFPGFTVGNTGFKNQSTFFRTPVGCTKIAVYLGNNNASTKSLDVKFVSVNKVISLLGGENISDYMSRNLPKGRYKALKPSAATGYATIGAKIGDQLDTFAVGDKIPVQYICVQEGRPPVFIPSVIPNSDEGKLKRGTTAQRPTGVRNGYDYYNIDLLRFEYWDQEKGWITGVPDATTGFSGLVKKAAAVTDIATANATDLATAIALANANKSKINQLLAAMRTALQLT